MQPELRLKLETRESLKCPVVDCGQTAGRIRGVELHCGDPGIDVWASMAFECSRRHRWTLSVDEKAGELIYEVTSHIVPLEDIPRTLGRIPEED